MFIKCIRIYEEFEHVFFMIEYDSGKLRTIFKEGKIFNYLSLAPKSVFKFIAKNRSRVTTFFDAKHGKELIYYRKGVL